MTDAPDGKRDFFISFTGADRPWARWLAKVLSGAGYSYWFQDQDFHGNIPRSIEAAHAGSERTILVLSDAYAQSGYCRSEWEMRYQDDPGGEKDLLILFRVGLCDPPPLLGRHDHRDLFACPDEATAEEEVRQRLRQAVAPSHRRPLGEATFPGGRQIDAPFPVPTHNLPPPSRLFLGRTAELATLAAALATSGRTAITQPQTITGLGGVGKTQLALNYAYLHLNEYNLIRWLRAEDPATLATDYEGTAPALGLDPATSDKVALRGALRDKLERRQRWLLVFDNATDPSSLVEYLPRLGTGHVLITSRHQDWRDSAGTLELDVLPEPEAVEMLLGEEAADLTQRHIATELAKELGCLPLALAQARAFMRARKVDAAGYLRQLAASRPKVMAWRPPSAPYLLSVAQVWQASIDAAANECPAARELLALLSFFASDTIPRFMLSTKVEALPKGLRDEFDRDTAIEKLARYSLLRIEFDALTVHRLIQTVTRDRLGAQIFEAHARSALRLAIAAFPRQIDEARRWTEIDAVFHTWRLQ